MTGVFAYPPAKAYFSDPPAKVYFSDQLTVPEAGGMLREGYTRTAERCAHLLAAGPAAEKAYGRAGQQMS